MVVARLRRGHIGCNRPEKSLAEEEDEGGCAVERARLDHSASSGKAVHAIVARACLAADRKRAAVGPRIGSLQARRRAIRYHTRQDTAQGAGNFRSHDANRDFGLSRERRVIRRMRGEVQLRDRLRGPFHAAVEDDPHEVGERIGDVARRAHGRA